MTEGSEKKIKKTFSGVVVSDTLEKAISVLVVRDQRHPLYGKVIHKSKKYLVHDEKNEASLGDKVSFIASRPLSKRKKWCLDKILVKANKESL